MDENTANVVITNYAIENANLRIRIAILENELKESKESKKESNQATHD